MYFYQNFAESMHKFSDVIRLAVVFAGIMLFSVPVLTAQTTSVPKSYTSDDGKLYWNKSMPVYIRLSNSPDSPGELVKSQTQTDVNPYFFPIEGANYVRSKQLNETTGTAQEIVWEVFADGESPKSVANFNSDTEYLNLGKRYYGKDLAIDVIGVDKLSGTEQTFYSINGLPFAPFSTPLQINREGAYTLDYYSTDKVGNKESAQSLDFTLDLTPPVSQHRIEGDLFKEIFSTETRIMLTANDSGSGISQIFYSFDSDEPRPFTGANISVSTLENGEHTLTYFARDNVKNDETAHTFSFYLDKKPPVLVSTIIGDQYVKDGKIYFSGRSKLSLSATDDKSGLQEVQYSVNNQTFAVYSEPFYLPQVSGLHTVKYFAIDSMQNKSETQRLIDARYENMIIKQEDLHADLSSPTIDFDFLGASFKTRDTLFLGGSTNIRLNGNDSESGINRIIYYIDDKPAETYSLPFSLEYIKSGVHKMRIVCYDNVNNQTSKEFTFILDNTPPELHYFFSVAPYAKQDGLDVYPEYVSIFLAASDESTGAKDITYELNEMPAKKYLGSVSGFRIGQKNILKFYTKDNLGNQRVTELSFYVR